MPFCFSCGAENPEAARFCAKCGQALGDGSAPAKPSAPATAPMASPPLARPEPVPAKEAMRAPKIQTPEPPKEPSPNAPGQTQFFIAAAQVSTAAKVKRIAFFIIGALVVGTVIFFLVQQIMNQNKEATEKKAEPPEAASEVTTPPETTTPTTTAPATTTEPSPQPPAGDTAKTEETKPEEKPVNQEVPAKGKGKITSKKKKVK